MRRSHAAAILVAIAMALGPGIAAAAARFDHASPAPGQVLASSPARVDVYVDIPTSASPGATQIIVADRLQQQVDRGDGAVDPHDHRHFSVDLRPNLPPGRYIVTFKTLSEHDLDHDAGQYAFYVGAQPTPAEHKADTILSVSTNDDQQGNLSGYKRGIVEGGLTLLVAVPVVFFYLQRRRRGANELDQLGGLRPPRE